MSAALCNDISLGDNGVYSFLVLSWDVIPIWAFLIA